MTKKLYGTVHGRTIELDEDPGVIDALLLGLRAISHKLSATSKLALSFPL